VVALRTGGLVDGVTDGVTSALAEPFDLVALADAIHWVLEDPEYHCRLAADCQRAEQLWDSARLAGLYAEVYQEEMECWVESKPINVVVLF
jgi:glycosyltransferase involved in cell wall biosynthesis